MKTLRWLLIGFRFKRYLISGIAGVTLLVCSLLVLMKDLAIGYIQLGVAVILGVLGLYLIILASTEYLLRFVNVYPNGMPKKPNHVRI